MKRLEKLKKERARLFAEMKAIVALAEKEQRDMTKEEYASHEGLEKSFLENKSAIDVEARMLGYETEVEEGDEVVAAEPTGETRSAPTVEQPTKKIFQSLGEQLRAVRNAASGGRADARLFEVRAASGLNEATPSDGGFLVQQDFAGELLKNAYEYGQLASRVTQRPISSGANGMSFLTVDETSRATGSRHGGVQVYWAAEAETKAASKPKFGKINMLLHKLLGFCYVTEEQLEDSSILGAEIGEAFRDEFAFVLDDAIVSGNGTGKPKGFLTSDALVTIAKEAGPQTADTIVTDNILKMYSRMYPRGLANGVWLTNQECFPQLAKLSLLVGTAGGSPVYLPSTGLAGAPFGTLLGRPIIVIEQASALGDLGDITFVDLSQYRMISKGTIKTSNSLHVRFLYDEQVFKFSYRCDGQPSWRKALTPYKGASGATISPFIALEAR